MASIGQRLAIPPRVNGPCFNDHLRKLAALGKDNEGAVGHHESTRGYL